MKLEGFDDFEKKLANLAKTAPQKRDLFVARQGEFVLGLVKNETPVNQGDLRDGWHRTEVSDGKTEVYNNTDYAAHVEYGHRQKERWVPGEWKGNRFIYDPDAKTGMKLKPKFIKGKKMLHRGLLAYKKSFAMQAAQTLKAILEGD